jgi:hypothetical protein
MWWETGVPGEISVLPQVIAQLKEKLYRVHLATRCNPTYNFNGESGCKSNYHMKNSKLITCGRMEISPGTPVSHHIQC